MEQALRLPTARTLLVPLIDFIIGAGGATLTYAAVDSGSIDLPRARLGFQARAACGRRRRGHKACAARSLNGQAASASTEATAAAVRSR